MPLSMATWVHCWFMFSQLLTKIPRLFFSTQLSSYSVPSLQFCMELQCSKRRTLRLILLKFIQLNSAYQSCLSRSLCCAFLPSGRSTLLPNLVSSDNLLRVYSIPTSKPSRKILNKFGPSTGPWGTPFMTSHQLDLTPFTITHLAWPSSQFT